MDKQVAWRDRASMWLYQDPLGRKIFWFIRWIFYPITILLDLADDPDTGTFRFGIITMMFGFMVFSFGVYLLFEGSTLAAWHPWLPTLAPLGFFLFYLFWGLLHHENMKELYGRGL